jgi:hypothetical protein
MAVIGVVCQLQLSIYNLHVFTWGRLSTTVVYIQPTCLHLDHVSYCHGSEPESYPGPRLPKSGLSVVVLTGGSFRLSRQGVISLYVAPGSCMVSGTIGDGNGLVLSSSWSGHLFPQECAIPFVRHLFTESAILFLNITPFCLPRLSQRACKVNGVNTYRGNAVNIWCRELVRGCFPRS